MTRPSQFADLRSFLAHLEARGELKRIALEIDPRLEFTEICARALEADGPALLCERVARGQGPMVGNLFGSPTRICAALGLSSPRELRAVGESLAFLRSPRLPASIGEAIGALPDFHRLAHVNPRIVHDAPCRENVIDGAGVDLGALPIQTCWPGDAGPLITWGLVITRGPRKARQNVGIYRQQVIGRNRVIMRWLHHRGGALDYREWLQAHPHRRFPVAVAIGADPATLLAAVAPIPDTLSEYQFAGLLRGAKTELTPSTAPGLEVPARAEYVLEGHIEPGDEALEGPFGDHTGFYNAAERFPVLTIERITHRDDPVYHGTYMGRPGGDEPSVLAAALNEVVIPLLKEQFPEVEDFYLPPEGCSYRMALVSIRKAYPGHARRIMFGIWSFLRQFTYTKFVIVTDHDIDVRDWAEVVWAMTTRMDPARDTVLVENTPIDYLDFASPETSLGSKVGFDATDKWPGETHRQWGRPLGMDEATKKRVDVLWRRLDL
ncbi:MAG: UbiD family decarboxylase [Proteobacteria bacterium]|nr:MAG: UbiD family decarboxylase [Pseudomonadota bacterium]